MMMMKPEKEKLNYTITMTFSSLALRLTQTPIQWVVEVKN
jgi:hypothetical protein